MNGKEPSGNAISDLMREHQRRLLFFILGIYPNRDAAEDILQETNHVIWSKRDEFEVGTNFLAWAKTIAKFQTLSFLKSRSSKFWLQFDSELVQDLASEIEERETNLADRKRMLADCLDGLSEIDRELVQRKYTLKESNKKIGRAIGRSEGGLKQAFLRIRRMLRECVSRKELAEG